MDHRLAAMSTPMAAAVVEDLDDGSDGPEKSDEGCQGCGNRVTSGRHLLVESQREGGKSHQCDRDKLQMYMKYLPRQQR